MTRSVLAAALALLAASGPARGADPEGDERPIRSVRFQGPRGPALAELHTRVRDLINRPATVDSLVAAIEALETAPRVGGLDVRIDPSPHGRTVDVVFLFDGRPLRLAALRMTTRRRGPADADESWRLARLAPTGDRPLRCREGRRFHPYFLRLDAETLSRFYIARGHRDVVVSPERQMEGGLITVTLRAWPGPRYEVGEIVIEGAEIDRARLLAQLETRAGEGAPVVPWRLDADAERVREQLCRRGFADATVSVQQQDLTASRVRLTFRAVPGAMHTIEGLQLTGDPVPKSVVAALPLAIGGPFCPRAVSDAETLLAGHLRDHGHPDALIEARVTTPLAAPGTPVRRVQVTLDVQARGRVRITRIWFDGNTVTREDVIRQLLTVEEGDLYRQRAIDTSVQNLLRSGLFKSADVQTLPGDRPSERYLIFTVVEQELVSLDLLEQSLTLRNLDLYDWPDDVDELASGRRLRGGGQEMTFIAQPEWQGLRFRDRFAHRYVLVEAELSRRTRELGPGEELWYTLEAGLGLKALQNRIALVGFGQLELTDPPDRKVYAALAANATAPDAAPLDVVLRFTTTTAAGVEGRVDLNRRDAERVPYLGFGLRGRYLRATTALGGDQGWHRADARLSLNLPVGTNDHEQHYVLGLRGRWQRVWTDALEELMMHQRPQPDIRGYGPRNIGIERSIGTDTFKVGGTQATSATAELRWPIPFGRRNALAPFVDTATTAEDDESILDRIHVSAGLTLYYSFFAERLEGFVHAAWPFQEVLEKRYVGVGAGGSF